MCPITTKLVLDEDEETKEPIVQVHRNLVTKLKPHQVDGENRSTQTNDQTCTVHIDTCLKMPNVKVMF